MSAAAAETPASSIRQRIFLVGAPRSGTTLLQSLLAAHTEVTSFTESHFFSRGFRRLPVFGAWVAWDDARDRVREFLAENGADSALAVDLPALPPKPLGLLATRRYSSALLEVLDAVAVGRGQSRWLEKTPRHLRAVQLLESLHGSAAPRLDIVHLVREGVDVVCSLHQAAKNWPQPYSLAQCVDRWNRDLAQSLSFLGRRAHHFVFYEDLVRDAEAVLRPLLSGLGLDWQERLLTGYGEQAKTLRTPQEPWKEEVGREIRASGGARSLPPELEQRLESDLYLRLREAVASRPLEPAEERLRR